MQVTVIATIKAKAGCEAAVEKELLALIPPTLTEEGCINYDLHRSSDDPRIFLFYENWRSKRDLDLHLEKPYLKRFGERTENLLDGDVEILLFEKIG